MTDTPAPAFSNQAGDQKPARMRELRFGILLVAASSIVWSFGGAMARFIETKDSWAIIFWRSFTAALFVLAFMLVRDRWRDVLSSFRAMGLPGLGVACCFSLASTAFVVALAHTTVANILLMQAGGPLIAALLTWALFRERISVATWIAIATVIGGVAIMVSESFTGKVSLLGDGLALLIAFAFASATVITRRHAHVAMAPAVLLGTLISMAVAATQVTSLKVSLADSGLLFAFGALNLGFGMALFVTGARLVPATLAALIGTLEPVLGPIWVWLAHGEVPTDRTLIGGAVVFTALLIHLSVDWYRQSCRAGLPAHETNAPPV